MAKYLFIQKSGMPWHGIMSLSAVLKRAGHDVDLILANEEKSLSYVMRYRPDYIGFPVITGEHLWVDTVSKTVKQALPKVKILVGSAHPTFYPEYYNGKDITVIRGEADSLILNPELASSTVGFFENLDNLPMPDRSIYYKYDYLGKASVKQFLTGRGCPYSCSFCSNHLLRSMLHNKVKFVRRRSPEKVIEEILDVKEKWNFKTISFTDDVFTLNIPWLHKFLELYKHEVKVPFMCNTRVELVNGALVGLLKEAGCYGLSMGIESGNARIRNEILMKNSVDNRQIIKAGLTIKELGLVLKTYNMIGLPDETLDDALETVKINSIIKADQTSCSFLIPYPKYKIAEYYDNPKIPDSIYEPLEGTSKEIINLQTFFLIGSKYPKLLPLIKILIKVKPNRAYRMLAMIFYGVFMARVHRLSLIDLLRYARHVKATKN